MSVNVGEKDIIPVITLDPTLPTHFIGDPLRIQQVLINLTSNAIKFSQHGEVILSIHQEKAEQGDNYPAGSATQQPQTASSSDCTIVFSVSDTGIGIEPSQMHNLFKAFSQADSSITRRFGGTGLGLAISNRLIGLMGSEITVTSHPGEGSHFTFRLSLKAHKNDARNTNTEGGQPSPKILLIESHQPSVDSLTAVLAQYHCTPAYHFTVKDYLNNYSDTHDTVLPPPVDAVLLDWDSAQAGIDDIQQFWTLLKQHYPTTRLLITCSSSHQEQTILSTPFIEDSPILVKPFTHSLIREALFNTQENRAQGEPVFEPIINGEAHVLVVDDTVLNQTIVTQMLEDLGVSYDVANNGAEAIQHYEQKTPQYDLIFMDIQMPIMDGLTATRKLRTDHRCTIPIIAMTAGALKSEYQSYLDAGMNDLVPKPIDQNELYQVLAHHTGEHTTNHHKNKPTAPTPMQSPAHGNPDTQASPNGADLDDEIIYFEASRIECLINGQPDRLKTISSALCRICDDVQSRLNRCDRALRKQNYDGLRYEIQSIKSLTANYGGLSLKPLLESLEACCNPQGVDPKNPSHSLEQSLKKVFLALEHYTIDAHAWIEQHKRTLDQQPVIPEKNSRLSNVELLTPSLRNDLFDVLETECYEKVKQLLEDMKSLSQEAGALAQKISPFLAEKDVDGIVNLLRDKATQQPPGKSKK
jgi:CheY-like chemotaxis protein/HPt (histidine-containing phosphotransfer) domain-containing protein